MIENRLNLPSIVGDGYADFWKCKSRYRIVKGGRASKKSKTSALNLIYRIMKYPLSNGLCVRRYGTTLRDSMYSDLKWAINKLGVQGYFEFRTSPLQIIHRSTGQKILFRALDDGMKITSISVEVGVLCFVWIEEAYEILEDDFNKLDMSIRGGVPDGYFKQLTLTFNPWSANSWLKSRFFDIQDEQVFTKTTNYTCNEWLDDSDIKLFDAMQKNNPRRYRIEGLGDWGIAEGLIYTNVGYENLDINNLKQTPNIKACFGLDFGFVDPNALICCLVDNAQKIIYIFDEWYKTGVTNQDIIQAIKDKGYGNQRIICDSAEPKSIYELTLGGINAFPSRKGRDSVAHGIKQIQNYKIVVDNKCTNFKNEISNYCYAKDSHGILLDRPDHEFSHGMDAMRYAVADALLPDLFSFE